MGHGAGGRVTETLPLCPGAVRGEAAELVHDVARQRGLVGLTRVGQEGLQVLADDSVEDGLGRPSGAVGRGEDGHEAAGVYRGRAGGGLCQVAGLRGFRGGPDGS